MPSDPMTGSNFSGAPTLLATSRHAPVDDRFRTVQVNTEPLWLKTIRPSTEGPLTRMFSLLGHAGSMVMPAFAHPRRTSRS
jgi:hypothetical protein